MKKNYKVVARYFDGRKAGSHQDSRLAICLYWAKERSLAIGDDLGFQFYRDNQLIIYPIKVR